MFHKDMTRKIVLLTFTTISTLAAYYNTLLIYLFKSWCPLKDYAYLTKPAAGLFRYL